MRGALRRIVLAALVVALFVPSSWAQPRPAEPSAGTLPYAAANLYDAAFRFVERLSAEGVSVPEQAGGTGFFTKTQMLAVLAWTERAERFPTLHEEALNRALEIWDAAQVAYNPSNKYYNDNLASHSACVRFETNAWALLATDRLGTVSGRRDIQDRAAEVANGLASAVAQGQSGSAPRCPEGAEVPPAQWPLSLWALLRYSSGHDAPIAQSAALGRLRMEIRDHFTTGFQDAPGLFLVQPNAIYLAVLQEASRAGLAGEFGPTQDRLARFVLDELLDTQNGQLLGVDLGPETGSKTFEESATSQVWLAYSLHNQRVGDGLVKPDTATVDRLLDAAVRRYWSPDEGGLRVDAFRTGVEPNGAASILLRGPALVPTSTDPPRVTLLVPALGNRSDARDGNASLMGVVSNEWTMRFAVLGTGPTPQRVLLPIDRAGAPTLKSPGSRETPAPALQREGVTIASSPVGGGLYPLLEATIPVRPGGENYRLLAYAPVFPRESRIAQDIRLLVDLDASQPITLGLLRLEAAVRNVTLESVELNGRPLPPEQAQSSGVPATDYLPIDHVRIDLHDVLLRPDVTNEILLSYADSVPPDLGQVAISHDEAGREAVGMQKDRFIVSPSGGNWVQVDATDNAALRSVTALVGSGVEAVGVQLHRSPPGSDHWAGQLPALSPNRATSLRIRAVDYHDTLKESKDYGLVALPSFLREGNLVLLVLSAVLLVGAGTVFLKMGRRRVRR